MGKDFIEKQAEKYAAELKIENPRWSSDEISAARESAKLDYCAGAAWGLSVEADWIDIEDRLPEHNQKVLALDRSGEIFLLVFRIEFGRKWEYVLSGNKDNGHIYISVEIDDICKWKPLPKKPEINQ